MRTALLVLVTVAALAATTPAALAQAGFFDISSGPTGLPAWGSVRDVAVGPDGALYASGRLWTSQTRTQEGVFRRTGNAWTLVGDAFNGEPLIAFAPDGSLWALGSLATASGTVIRDVARFDGTAWAGVGATFNSNVTGLAIASDGTVVVTGIFSTVNGATAWHVAQLRGGVWSAVPGAPTPRFGFPISVGQPVANGADVVVSFTLRQSEEGPFERRVARVSGGAWRDTGLFPAGNTNGTLLFATSPSGVLFAMNPNAAVGQTAFPVYQWTGSAWTALAGPLPSAPGAFSVSPDGTLYASYVSATTQNGGGTATLVRRVGTSWVPFGTYSQLSQTTIQATLRYAFSETSVYAGGSFLEMNGLPVTYVGRYDGAAWHVLGSEGDNHVFNVFAGPNGDVYATGNFTRIGGALAKSLARWDGAAWHAVGAAAGVSWIASAPDGTRVACGGFSQIGGVAATRVARWDGAAWSALGAGLGSVGTSQSVYRCAAGPGGAVYASGPYGTTDQDLVSRWNGSAWTTIATLNQAGQVRSMAVGRDGALYVSGGFTSIEGVAASHIARWSGGAWSALGSGLPSPAGLTAGPNGEVVAVGRFTTAGGAPASRIARWNGTAWSGYGAGLYRDLSTAAFGPDGTLYAGGEPGAIGLIGGSGAYRWDGAAWTDLVPNTPDGAGFINSHVRALVVDQRGDVIIGGEFTNVGRVRSPFVVRFGRPATVSTEEDPRDGLALAVGPNPSRGTATAFVTGPAGEQTVEVLDALGRRVARTSGFATAGRREVPMPSGLTPGLYVVRVTAGAETRTVRFVVVR